MKEQFDEIDFITISKNTIMRKPFYGDIMMDAGNELRIYTNVEGRLFVADGCKVVITQNFDGAIYADGNAEIILKCEEFTGAVLLYEATLIIEKKCFFDGTVYTDEGNIINNSEQDIEIEEMSAEEQSLFEL